MATTKVTVTLPDEQVEEIRALVAAGEVTSVSGFVKHSIGVALHDAAGWREMLDIALAETGGALTKQERTWADGILASQAPKRPARKKKAA
ncbi:MAG: ribbon-helix-helix domain-containing protein [Bryobacteraceae bacterium]